MLQDIATGTVPLFREKCPKCGYVSDLTAKDVAKLAPSPSDRAKALDLMAKYGFGPPKVGYDEELVDNLISAANEVLLPLDNGADIGQKIAEAWVPILAQKRNDG